MSYTYQPKPTMTSRAGWGADSANYQGFGSNSPQYIIVHHSGEPNDDFSTLYGSNEKAFMKRIQEIHIGNTYGDIGYNYGIGVNGLIMDGRDDSVEGCHTLSGYNTKSIGVCVLGNYDIRSFTSSQEQSLVDLLAWLCYTYNVSYSNIIGHKDVSATSCPGSDIYSELSSIKGQVNRKLNPIIQP